MIRTILVALDDSARAGAVFDTACELARALRARLVLFRGVVISPEFSLGGAGPDEDQLASKLLHAARESLLTYRARAAELDCEIRVGSIAQAWRSILGAAEETHADLIVIGSHGYRGWDRLLGTTADTVVNFAQRDVLVVHEFIHAAGTPDGGHQD